MPTMHHTAQHLGTLGVCVAFSLGCFLSNVPLSHQSGDYRHHDVGDHVGAPRPAFVPDGLTESATMRPTVRRIAIAELGEPAVPESVVKRLTHKGRRQVISLPSNSFVSPPAGMFERVWLEALRQAAANAVITTQPSPGTTRPSYQITTKVEINDADFRRISEENDREMKRQVSLQTAREIERLREEARKHNADALLLITTSHLVGPSEQTVFGFLNLLILPAYLIPTEYFNGQAVAHAWLIDPATGQVLNQAGWQDEYSRVTQTMYSEGNRQRLLKHQRFQAVEEVAKKVLDP